VADFTAATAILLERSVFVFVGRNHKITEAPSADPSFVPRLLMASLRLLALALCLGSCSFAADLVTHEGKKASGEIVAIDAKELTLKTASGLDTYELTRLSQVDVPPAPKDPAPGTKWIEVELIDGSQFRCADFKMKGKIATLTFLGTKQTLDIPANTLLYMIRDLSDAKINQAFRGILSKRGKRDIWIFPKGDSLDATTGTFDDADDKGENIQFELEANGEKLNIQTTRIYGMIYNQPPGVLLAQTVCRVIDSNKNIIFAKNFILSADKTFTVETVTGAKIVYPSMASISKFDFSAGSLMFLSNAEPTKVDLSSTEGIPEPYRRDRNLDNGDLKMGSVKYSKGLALHSRTQLTYDLGGKYKTFQAIVGVDDCVEGESKSTLIIEADFKPIFTEVIKKGDKPRALNLNVLNVKQLRITVESDFLDLGNQVDLADAKLLK